MAQNSALRRGDEAVEELFTIGQVRARLIDEFPELTPSKLRFLEDQGLVTPVRTATKYRMFNANDVQRIQLILRMQRDQFMPLKVINQQVDAVLNGNVAVLPSLTKSARYSRNELIAAAGSTAKIFDSAVAMSFIQAKESYGEDSRDLLLSLTQLHQFGVEPRHLTGIRKVAEREAEFVLQLQAGRRRPEQAEDIARTLENALATARLIDAVRNSVVSASIKKELSKR